MSGLRRVGWMAFLLAALYSVPVAAEEAGRDGGVRPRIISLYAAHTEVLLRLGARENIIGVSRQETYAGPETEGWKPEIFSIRDDVEKYLAAKPDIILARPQHIAGSGHLRNALDKAGIRMIALQVTNADGLYGYWRELGALVGREKEAEELVARFDATVERYRTASKRLTRRPGVFVEAMHREVKTFTPDSIPAWMVELCGGRYVASDAEPATPGVIIADYGPERLLARSGEIDVFISQEGAMNRVALETVRERNIYQPIRAFKEGRVYKIPEDRLARPTPSLAEGMKMLAEWTGLDVEMSDEIPNGD